ncbi:MAG: helicase C-terminal domain-containing protein [Candidatus Gracilibacteria bacterium]|nr:helicase C-terminal domain-containing protein [Candidatus Gracilibacteria bacterium]
MLIALDLETTGLEKEKDKIIEIALIKFDENTFEIIETFETLINPLIPIPEVISNITNIFDTDIIQAPVLNSELKQKIENFIGNNPILGHNTNFDRDFLIKNGIQIEENLVLDTFILSNIILLYEKSLNLGSLCESLDLELTDAHRALGDTIGTIKLFKELFKKFTGLEKEKKELLNFLFSKSNSKSFKYYKDLFFNNIELINEEDFIKKTLKIIGKYNKENNSKQEEIEEYNFKTIKEIFENLPNSELRQNQLEMSLKIDDSLKNDKKIVIEAPTGVGKTFAYLIPGVIYALKNKEQVIISTNTKALQDQIFYKDLEFLNKNLSYNFSFSKLKGKRNYFSISRYFNYLFNNSLLDIDETTFFSKICLWLFDTKFGELDELNYYPKEYFFQRNISGDHFLVLFESNEYKLYEHLYKARTIAQNSNIVIINHSLLIQDSTSSQPLFGQIKNLIVDEAHNLEDTTTDALKKTFSLQSLQESIDKILNIISKSNFVIENLDNKFNNLFGLVALSFDLFFDYAIKQNTFGNESYEALLEKDFYLENKDIVNLSNNIEISLIEIFNHLQTSPDKIYNLLKTEISNLEEVLQILKIAFDKKSILSYIPIFSYNKLGNNTLSYTILNPGNFLNLTLWQKIDSIVLTSATIKINDNFEYIKNILDLIDFEFLAFESDFDYSKQALLFIPNDLGSIKYNNPKINEFILSFLQIVLGNTLVLLTSFNSIKDLFLTLNIPLKKLGTSILAQGVGGSKHKIANHFKKYSSSSVILGTDSFWEGVDIPGDDLKYLFIHKFPFLVPTDPIFKARGKLYNDSFRDYSIPKAIIKTKQGFGRLIRTKKDTGIIILLDDRYFSTNWGITMKSSFPHNINIKIGSSQSFLDLIKTKF